MLFLKYILLITGIGMFVVAAAIVVNDAWLIVQYRRRTALGIVTAAPQPIRWRATVALACLAWAPWLMALSLVWPVACSSVRTDQTTASVSQTLNRTH
jgi:hypothetical protein